MSEPVFLNADDGDVKVEDIIEKEIEEEKEPQIEEIESIESKELDEEKQVIPKNEATQVKVFAPDEEDDDDVVVDEFDEDETLAERLWGLTEMFPEPVRNATWTVSTSSVSCVKGLYQFSRSLVWVLTTSAIILAVPTLIENEKSQLEELNRQQQRQILLGPSASLGSTPSLTPSLTP